MICLHYIVFCLTLLSSCCNNSYREAPVICQRCRPQTAIIPVINTTDCAVTWDVSRELTNEVVDSMIDRSTLSVTPLAQYRNAIDQMKGADLFGKDLSFSNNFAHNDFLVIMELVKHDTLPFDKAKFTHINTNRPAECHAVLSLGMRLRVIDLRSEEPKIVLQELVECDQLLSSRAAKIDYSTLTCDSPGYQETPLAIAHQMLAQELAEKIEYATLTHW